MNITITINTDNAAFNEESYGPQEEVQRILEDLADRLVDNSMENITSLRDINGNTVGHFTITD